MPPKKGQQEAAEAPPPPPDPLVSQSETLSTCFGELRDATAKGEFRSLTEAAAARKWLLAKNRATEESEAPPGAGSSNPGQYADWVRRFGFSIEREIEHHEKEVLAQKKQHARTARHVSHLKAAEKRTVAEDEAVVTAKTAMAGPLPHRPAPFPYAVAKDQVDAILTMLPSDSAGDAFDLVRKTNYDDVDFHALVNVGACHPQAVGMKPEDEANASLTLDQVVAQLVRPYETTSWRLSAFDAAHFKVRAIARWIAAFVRVVPPPLGPPPASSAAPAVPNPSAGGKGVKLAESSVVSAPPRGPAPNWSPYRVEDDDVEGSDDALPSMKGDGKTPSESAERRGQATAEAVFTTRVGDPHQVAVLFSYMCRHPSAKLVFSLPRAANAAVSGRLPLEADADPTSYSAFGSVRETVAMPTGVAQTYVDGMLQTTPSATLTTTVGDSQPVEVRTVRGTLKGSMDAHGKPIGYMPWSWNLVTLPDGKQYLLDVALCAMNVPVKFLLQHHTSCQAVTAGELAPGAGDGAPAASGGKDKGGAKGAAADKSAAAAASSSSPAEAITNALSSTYGAYQPLSGRLQFHAAEELARVAEAVHTPQTPAVKTSREVTPLQGSRGFTKAPMMIQGGTGVTPAIACTVVACQEAGVPHGHAQGAWADQQAPAGNAAPMPLTQLASLLTRTCFEPSYFFADPRHFALLHYPKDQDHLLLAPPAPAHNDAEHSHAGGSHRHHHHHAPKLVSQAQWEAYPRFTHAASSIGFVPESHARRSMFATKSCPAYMSFVLGNAPQTELQVLVFKGPLTAIVNNQVTVMAPPPSDGMSPEAYTQAADVSSATSLAQAQSQYSVICHTAASKAQGSSSPPSAAAGQPGQTGTAQNQQGQLSLVDPTYDGLTREEQNQRSVLSLMVPDVGLYTICIGARRLDARGRPASSAFTLLTAYQTNVSFVPTNEPLLPRLHEPPTVAKIVAPVTSRVTTGNTYFAVAPTLSDVVAAVVINEVAPVVHKVPKAVLAASQVADSSAADADPTSPTSPTKSVKQREERPGFTKTFFLPWDANTASFNGTCAVEAGTVSVWLGMRVEQAEVDELASMVPPHLLPSATSATSAQLLATIFAKNSSGGRAGDPASPSPDAPSAASPTPQPTGQPTEGEERPTATLPKPAFDVLAKIQVVSKPNAAEAAPLTPAALLAAWKPETAPAEEQQEQPSGKGSKGKGGKKAAAASAAAAARPVAVAKPPPAAVFVPLMSGVQASKRIASKDATLLTNNYSPGAEAPPRDVDSYVPPKSLLYAPAPTGGEQRVTHGILARTVDDETIAIVSDAKHAVGTVFDGRKPQHSATQ